MLREKLRNRKGFTLIEIIVVIVILAVLMAVAVPSVLSYINEGNKAKYESVARSVLITAQTEYAKAIADGSDGADPVTEEKAKTTVEGKLTQEKKFGDNVVVAVKAANITLTPSTGDPDSKDIKTIKCDITINGVKKAVTIDANKKVTVSAAS